MINLAVKKSRKPSKSPLILPSNISNSYLSFSASMNFQHLLSNFLQFKSRVIIYSVSSFKAYAFAVDVFHSSTFSAMYCNPVMILFNGVDSTACSNVKSHRIARFYKIALFSNISSSWSSLLILARSLITG